MRNLFMVLAKVVGLLQVATAIWKCEPLLQSIAVFGRFVGSSSSVTICWDIAGRCLMVGLFLAFAWVLLFKSEWLADRLGLAEERLSCPDCETILWVGIKLLGLYVLAESIPALVWTTIGSRALIQNGDPGFWVRIVPAVVKVVLGLILVFTTTKLMEFISRDGKPKEMASI
ncbi:MAG: hypothetical protein GX455_04865 [Phycisphaerae bacterium]|nr:hypothetical protein [Phycisphaerae bacterium]